MNTWNLGMVIHYLIQVIIVSDSCSSIRSIVGVQNIIGSTVSCLNIEVFDTGFILHLFELYSSVGHLKFYHKLQSMQLSDVTCLAAILGCTILQSQWLLRLLAFWKFVLILLMLSGTTNACDCLLMQHLLCTAVPVLALKVFTSLDQTVMWNLLIQPVWIIIIGCLVMLQLYNWLLELYYSGWYNLIYLCIMWLFKELSHVNCFILGRNIIFETYIIILIFCAMILSITGEITITINAETLVVLPATGVDSYLGTATTDIYKVGTPVSHAAQGSKKFSFAISGINNIDRRDSESCSSYQPHTPRLTVQGSNIFVTKLQLVFQLPYVASGGCHTIDYNSGNIETNVPSSCKEESGLKIGLKQAMELVKEHESMLDES